MKKVLGITGKIASGKTTVCGFLRQIGFNVIDADKIAHEVLEKVCGNVSREELAKVVFSDREKMKALENKIRPKVIEEIKRRIEKCKRDKICVEAIDLGEIECDEVWLLEADKKLRLERLIKRGGEKESAERKIEYQEKYFSVSEKCRVIENEDENLKNKINKIYEESSFSR